MFYAFELMQPADSPSPSYKPLFLERVPCGFPSPCQDYAEQELDLNEYLVAHKASTFFLRAEGSSMQDFGLYDGELLIEDRSLKPQSGDVVIAEVHGEFTVKRLLITPGACTSAYESCLQRNTSRSGCAADFWRGGALRAHDPKEKLTCLVL